MKKSNQPTALPDNYRPAKRVQNLLIGILVLCSIGVQAQTTPTFWQRLNVNYELKSARVIERFRLPADTLSNADDGSQAFLNHVLYVKDTIWKPFTGGGGSGTISSLGLAMPSGFTVSGSPINGNGTISVGTSLNGLLYGTGSGFSTVTTNAPLSFNGGILSVRKGTPSQDGYISSSDFTNFQSGYNKKITGVSVIGNTTKTVVITTQDGTQYTGSFTDNEAPPNSGITSINGDASSTQSFTTGTTGTDFSIVTNSGITTFNFPTANPSNRGLLSPSDYNLFFNKTDNFFISLSGLRAITSPSTTIKYFITDKGYEGYFLYDPSDASSTDNTGTCIVSSNGKRFKRIYTGPAQASWFGIKADNLTDNATALNLAIQSVPWLRLDSGITLTSAAIHILKSNFILEGYGANSILKRKDFSLVNGVNTTDGEGMLLAIGDVGVGADNVTIRNIKLDGNYQNQTAGLANTAGGYVVWRRSSKNTTFDNVDIINGYGDGLYSMSCSGLHVNNCRIKYNGWGLSVSSKNGISLQGVLGSSFYGQNENDIITNSKIIGNHDANIAFGLASDLTVANNDIDSAGFAGIEGVSDYLTTITNTPRNANIHDNYMRANTNALTLANGSQQNYNIHDNHIYNTGATVLDCQQLLGGTLNFSDNFVRNFKISDTSASTHGFQIKVDNFVFKNNKIAQDTVQKGGVFMVLFYAKKVDMGGNTCDSLASYLSIANSIMPTYGDTTDLIDIYGNKFLHGLNDAIRISLSGNDPYTTKRIKIHDNYATELGQSSTQRSFVNVTGTNGSKGLQSLEYYGNTVTDPRPTPHLYYGIQFTSGDTVQNFYAWKNDLHVAGTGIALNGLVVQGTLDRSDNIYLAGFPFSGTTSQRPTPTAQEKGIKYWNLDEGQYDYWNGSAWVKGIVYSDIVGNGSFKSAATVKAGTDTYSTNDSLSVFTVQQGHKFFDGGISQNQWLQTWIDSNRRSPIVSLINNAGLQKWYFDNGNPVGSLEYTFIANTFGIMFRDSLGNGRSQIRMMPGGGLNISAGTGSTNPGDQHSFFPSGNVGIGTTTDNGYKLNVNGTTNLGNTVTMSTVADSSGDILTQGPVTKVVHKRTISELANDISPYLNIPSGGGDSSLFVTHTYLDSVRNLPLNIYGTGGVLRLNDTTFTADTVNVLQRIRAANLVVDNIASLRNAPYGLYKFATATYYASAGDNGKTEWYWDASSSLADDGVYVIKPTANSGNGRWIRVFKGQISAATAGIKGDGTDQASLLHTLCMNATVNEIVFETVSPTIASKLDANGKKLIFRNGQMLKGVSGSADTLTNAFIECDPLKQCLDTSLNFGPLNNNEFSSAWFGLKADYGSANTPNHKAMVNALNASWADQSYYTKKLYIQKGRYYMDSTISIANKSAYLQGIGSVELWFPAGMMGFSITRSTGFSPYTEIHDLSVLASSKSSSDTLHLIHGMNITARTTLQNMEVYGFSGDGLHFSGDIVGSGTETSLSTIKNIEAAANWNGFWSYGPDANLMTFLDCDARDNLRIGFNDSSFLGNKYLICHTNDNHQGGFAVWNVNARCEITNSYSEANQAPSILNTRSSVYGGIHANGFVPATGGGNGTGSIGFINEGAYASHLIFQDNAGGAAAIDTTGGVSMTWLANSAAENLKFGKASTGGTHYGWTWGNSNGSTNFFQILPGNNEAQLKDGVWTPGTNRTQNEATVAFRDFYLNGRRQYYNTNNTTYYRAGMLNREQDWLGDVIWNGFNDGTQPALFQVIARGMSNATFTDTVHVSGLGTNLTLTGTPTNIKVGDALLINGISVIVTSLSGTSMSVDRSVGSVTNGTIAFATTHRRAFGSGMGSTSQRPSLTSDDAGFWFYNTDSLKNEYWTGSAWKSLNNPSSISGSTSQIAYFGGANSLGGDNNFLTTLTKFTALRDTILLGDASNYAQLTANTGTVSMGTPSYSNTGGSGNRSSVITVSTTLTMGAGVITRLVNGDYTSNGTWVTNQAVLNKTITFDFGAGAQKYITEAKWYQSTADTHGTWKWQGSNDNSTYTDIGSSFTLGGATTQTITTLSGNTTAYRYYRLIGISGSANPAPYIYQVDFKIADPVVGPSSLNLQAIVAGSAGGNINLQPNGGNVTVPTVAAHDSSGKAASTLYVDRAVSAISGGVASATGEGVTEVTTQNYTATGSENNIIYAYAGTGGTITLPASPADKTVIWISNVSGGSVNLSVTVYQSSVTGTTSIPVGHGKKLVYKASATKWYDIITQ